MRIAVLADIHGNAEALARSLDAARKQRVEHLLVLGDIVGYYYAAREVLAMLREWSFDAVRGNHERLLDRALQSEDAARGYRAKYGSALDVARETLDARDIDWLISLPDRRRVSLGGMEIEICHGSPRDPDEYVYPDAPADLLNGCAVPGADLVLMGHTHYPMIRPGPGGVLLNPGSVGQARDRGGSASWCRIDTASRVVVFERTPYDAGPLVIEARRRDPGLGYLADVLGRGTPALVKPSGPGN